MKLKTQILFVLIFIITLLAASLAWQQMRAIRISIAEEIETAGSIGTQVLSRVNELYKNEGARPMQRFLRRLGRLRAHDIVLVDEFGNALYRTPASDYLDESQAPAWFIKAVSPEITERTFDLSNGQLIVRTDGSRATLEGWKEFRFLLLSIALGVIGISLFAWWLVDRAMAPFNRVTDALRAVEAGDYDVKLPELPGAEANAIGRTFNSMVDSVRTSIAAREAAALATAELARNRELTHTIQQRIEHEHRLLAQELHDELGQHVTAIKSLGVSISRRSADTEPSVSRASDLVVDSADRIHAAMRQMLTRLRPASLDQFGLSDAVSDLVSDWRIKHPEKRFTFQTDGVPEILPVDLSTTAYRIAQEAVTNAVRHSGANCIDTHLSVSDDTLLLTVEDNGVGVDPKSMQAGYGVTGMTERATAMNGTLQLQPTTLGGSRVTATLPMFQVADKHHAPPSEIAREN